MCGVPNVYSGPSHAILGIKYAGDTGHPLGPISVAEAMAYAVICV